MKEKRKEAVALSYDKEKHRAPIVKAKGKGLVAEKIINEAKEHGVPIHEDAALAQLLDRINIDETIPEELFRAVAEVFAFIYRADRETKGK